jgi:hypothetical protein
VPFVVCGSVSILGAWFDRDVGFPLRRSGLHADFPINPPGAARGSSRGNTGAHNKNALPMRHRRADRQDEARPLRRNAGPECRAALGPKVLPPKRREKPAGLVPPALISFIVRERV